MKLLNEKNFDDLVKSQNTVLVTFSAEWCSPCSILSKHLETLDKKFKNRVEVRKVNVDEAQELVAL